VTAPEAVPEPPAPCRRCGRTDGHHSWVEGDCVLPHRNHSTRLLDGTQVCVWCVERHRTWLAEILDLYATLGDVLLAGSIPDDTAEHKHVKKSADTPVPIRLAVFAMLRDRARLTAPVRQDDGTYLAAGYLTSALPDIPAVLTSWARNALEDQGMAGASLDSTLSTACKLLDVHAERIAGLPWVDEYDAELGWCRRALQRAHGVKTNPPPLGRCITVTDTRSCTGQVWPVHGALPRCSKCGRRYGKLEIVRMRLSNVETA
jgi:hypothetical protein